MRHRPGMLGGAVAMVVLLGAAAPAAAQESPLSDVLAPVLDLLGEDDDGEDDDGPDNSGPGNADDRPDPPPPSAPAPPVTPATPAPVATPAPTAPAPPARPRSPVSLRYLTGRHLMLPAAGTVLGGLQPTLQWRGGPAGVDLYNVQIFSAAGTKVMSAFPASRSLRIPAKRLAPGRRFVWRVWPHTRRNGYTKRPLALSWFATPSRTVLAAR